MTVKIISVDRTVHRQGVKKVLTQDHVVPSGGDIRWDCDVDGLTIAVEAYREWDFDVVAGRTQDDVNLSAMWSNPKVQKRGQCEYDDRVYRDR